jgi:hypothetical protein
MYDSYKTAVGGQTRDVKTVDSGGCLDEERSARKEFGSRAFGALQKLFSHLPVPSLTDLLTSNYLALACAVQRVQGARALQKLFSHYRYLL